jgi:hypothetical protein
VFNRFGDLDRCALGPGKVARICKLLEAEGINEGKGAIKWARP